MVLPAQGPVKRAAAAAEVGAAPRLAAACREVTAELGASQAAVVVVVVASTPHGVLGQAVMEETESAEYGRGRGEQLCGCW